MIDDLREVSQRKLAALRRSLTLETDPSCKFKLEEEIASLESDINNSSPSPIEIQNSISPHVEFKFFNREKERERIHELRECFLYISTPPYYGKTYLLKKLKEERMNRKDKWCVAFFSIRDVPDLANLSKDDALLEFSRFITQQLKLDVNLLASLGNGGNEQPKLLILIDDVHAVIEDKYQPTLEALQSFLRVLYSLPPLKADFFQIILAGRYIASHRVTINFPLLHFSEVDMGEFEQKDIHFMLEEALDLHKIKMAPTTERNREFFQSWTKDIESLSCGHPQVIVKLVEHLVMEIKSKGILTPKDVVAKNEQQLFKRHVTPLLDKMLSTFSEESKKLLTILSVFNSFNMGTISFLENEGHINKGTPEDMLQRLEILGTICRRGINTLYAFYYDAILIDLLRKNLRINDEQLYQKINESAIELSESLFNEHKWDQDFFGKQFVYHAIQTGNEQVYVDALKKYYSYARGCYHYSKAEQLKNSFVSLEKVDRVTSRVNESIFRFLETHPSLLNILDKENSDG